MRGQAQATAHVVSAYYGTVTDDVPDEQTDLYVDIPGIGVKEGPCKWTPRATSGGIILPQAGNEALVAFDDQNTPWVLLYIST